MKLLTHNRLVCVRKDCDNAFPLRIEFEHVEALEDEPDIPKTLHILSRIDYPVLYAAASQLEIKDLPEELPDDLNAQRDEKLLIALHNAIFNINVVQGTLQCPVCKKKYPIQSGIPNIRLDESELT